jgi:hypothetical protein
MPMARTAGLPQATYADTLPLAETNYAPSHIGNDPAAYLPPGAADRLRKLQQRVDDRHAVIPNFDDRHLASLAKAECQRRIDRMLEHPSRGGFGLAEDDGKVTSERRKLSALTAEAARLESLYTARATAFQAAGAILSSVRGWLAEARPIEDFGGAEPSLLKNQSIPDAIAHLRGRIRELKTRRAEIERAPPPRAVVRDRVRQQVLTLAAKGAPSIGPDGKISAASRRMSVPIVGGTRENPITAIVAWEQPDVLPLIAWLNPEAVIAALTSAEAAADDSGTMTDEARRKALAETAAALLSAERAEAHWIWHSLDEGLPNIEFRPDTDVCAVLNVQISSAPRALAAGSSDDHSYQLVGRF